MRYKINKSNYKDFGVFEVCKLKPRSYFIPYPDRKSADAVKAADKRYGSPKVRCLNGIWDFKFYPRPSELPDIINTDSMRFDKIDVPSCWQFRGYDRPFYVNMRYQFPYDPPNIPEEAPAGRVFALMGADYGIGPRWRRPKNEYNFVGVYRTLFPGTKETGEGKRHILSFLGIATCADIYLNGQFVGYSEGSHNTAEFDITPYLYDAQNELLVVVRRWCNGTYLEDQDMFRNNGIFRDVLLRIEEPSDIWDIDFKCAKRNGKYSAIARAEFDGEAVEAGSKVRFSLEAHGISLSKEIEIAEGIAEAVFEDLEVDEWSAENPVLYDLYLETKSACIKMHVGFRTVEIKGDVFLINGSRVKLHGVNHHDTHPKNGYTMSTGDIEQDMKLCKAFNIDTVRTSHYPPDPYLLEVCDELGIYVICEADIETHGTYIHKLPMSYNRISDDPKWEAHYVDRAARLYQRDKLHPSIIMWSLGNEAGGTHNTDAEYDYIKRFSDLPVHYESAIHAGRKAYDVASEMYPPAERVHEIGEKKYKIKQLCDRPYFLCEYAHAMGVGPGGMEDYWKEIYTHDNLFGGCVWEMIDHAVLHDDGSYTYGGDHGEWEHDGNFCVDGLFYPDRSPSTGAKITKFIYRPIRFTYLGGNRFEIFNTRSFTKASDYAICLKWSDGAESKLDAKCRPLSRDVIDIDVSDHVRSCTDAGTDCLLDVIVKDKRTDEVVSEEQLIINELISGAPAGTGTYKLPEAFSDEFWQGVGTILFRAPTDNDMVMLGTRNLMKGFTDQRNEIVSVEKDDSKLSVTTLIECGKGSFECTDVYEAADESGRSILLTSKLKCKKGRGNLPRFGKTFKFDKGFDDVRYYGRCGESYADMKDHAPIREVSCKVSDMTEPNIRPQESGNRADTRWMELGNGDEVFRFTAIDKSFDLGVKPYSDSELLNMKHREDEKRSGSYVTISAFQQGIGTGICGPETAEKFKYPVTGEYELKILITREHLR